MEYSIYQVKSDKLNEKGFRSYNSIVEDFTAVDLKDYENVYSGKIESMPARNALEKLFETFNIHQPADYKNRSVSVSDIIILDNDAYYCDDIGWVKIDSWKE